MNIAATAMNHPMVTLVRRELWEHRALWIAPLVVAGLLLLGVISGAAFGRGEVYFDFSVPESRRDAVLGIAILSLTAPQYLTMLAMLFFYLIDCLYTERKDRSILFWKSMPVSDTATVTSKLLVALVVVPLGVFALTSVTDLLVAGIMALSAHGTAIWDTGTWLKIRAAMLPGLGILMLWYAPVAAYLLLVSAWARRNVFLWAVLPPFLLMMIENRAFETNYVGTFLAYRLNGVWKYFEPARGLDRIWDDGLPSLGTLVHNVGGLRALGDADMWLGLVFALALTYAAIRIRRYRDDT